MSMALAAAAAAVALVLANLSCSRFGPVYPSRPTPAAGAPFADPEPARIVAHLSVSLTALAKALDDVVPRSGQGTFPLLSSERSYTWERGPLDLSVSLGRLVLQAKILAKVSLPIRAVGLPVDIRIDAEPVVSADYAVKLQSVDVRATSSDTRVAVVNRIVGVYDPIAAAVAAKIREFTYDLRPLVTEAGARIERPFAITVGDATGCARLRVLEVEAGPTVLADGIEKDIALVVAPSITLPCAVDGDRGVPPSLPPLSNVSAIASGPFLVTIPIAARYDELTRAMTMAFTDGKLFFSADYPSIYLSKPELYESQGALVLKVHIGGPIHTLGMDSALDGDLYLVGHPALIDNELAIPDLEPTIETRSFLLSLKALTDSDRIRDQARAALRLDIGLRLRDARDKLGDGLTFQAANGCFRGDVDRVAVTGIHPHAGYLRVYVSVTARARLSVPCSSPVAPDP